MAFSLAQASPEDEIYPLPWAPQIRDANRRTLRFWFGFDVLVRTVLLTAGVMVFAGLVLGLFDGFSLGAGGTWGMGLMLVGMLLVVAWTLGGFLTTGLVRAVGHGRAGTNTVSGRHSLAAGGLAKLNPGLYCAALAMGFLIAAIGVLAVPGVASTLVTIAYACLAALSGYTAARYLATALRGWRAEVVAEQIARGVLARGVRTVAVVSAVDFREIWLDQQPAFVVRAVHPCHLGERDVEFTLVDYPRWAPMVGNEFDVWFDPHHLDDRRYTLLERRIVGQRFPTDVEQLRRPASGGDGPGIGPVEPDWVKELVEYPSVTAEEVHHALRSHDPHALPRLKALHGYSAGERYKR